MVLEYHGTPSTYICVCRFVIDIVLEYFKITPRAVKETCTRVHDHERQ